QLRPSIPNVAQDVPTRRVGHDHVRENDVDGRGGQRGLDAGPTGERDDLVAERAEDAAEEEPHGFRVVHDEDPHLGGGMLEDLSLRYRWLRSMPRRSAVRVMFHSLARSSARM